MLEPEFVQEFLEVSDDDKEWKPCRRCGGKIIQIRKAKFECSKCFQDYIADEKDMKK